MRQRQRETHAERKRESGTHTRERGPHLPAEAWTAKALIKGRQKKRSDNKSKRMFDTSFSYDFASNEEIKCERLCGATENVPMRRTGAQRCSKVSLSVQRGILSERERRRRRKRHTTSEPYSMAMTDTGSIRSLLHNARVLLRIRTWLRRDPKIHRPPTRHQERMTPCDVLV